MAELRQLQADIQAMDLFGPNDMVLISPEWGRVDVYFAEENKKSGAGLQKLEHSDAIVVLTLWNTIDSLLNRQTQNKEKQRPRRTGGVIW